MPADDYYGYAPLAHLERPLVLCGLPGSDPGATARVVSMFTGLGLVRVEDQVAHLAGQAYDAVVLRDGVEAALQIEAKVLSKALARRTPPVIGLSTFSLRDAERRAQLLAACDVRYLSMSLEESVHRVRVAALADARCHAALRDGDPPDARHLLPKLRFLDRLCREAPSVIDIRERSVMQVGRALADELSATRG